jgi:4-hydroxybenzoate polyprenyltransferase
MIKFEHTIFALPFAILSAFCAREGIPHLQKIIFILLAMVGARSFAMAFNRLVDLKFDIQNPRTKDREMPRGTISISFCVGFIICMFGLFVFSAYMLNFTCFLLSFPAGFLLLFYSYTKRFTWLTHFILGLCLALAPLGAWLAINESIDIYPILLGVVVMFWVAGFDMIYSLLDVEFDKGARLYSIPAVFGVKAGLIVSSISHFIVIAALFGLVILKPGPFFVAGCILTTVLLLYEHIIARPDEPRKINKAFFNLNAIISVVIMTGGLADLLAL